MDEDPFYGVKAEVESTLATLVSLSSSYSRLLRQTPAAQHSSSSEVQWSLSELRASLAAIEPDVAELNETVEAIEAPGIARRLGIADREVRARRDFVERVKSEISAIRRQLPSPSSRSPSPEMARKRLSAASSAYPPSYHTTASYPLEASDAEASDPNAEFEMQHQSLLREQQDRTLTDISGTVGLLREQAKVIGHEVFEQTAMIEELDHHVDSTASRLTKAQRKMDRFIKDNSSSPASWCILVLIVVLSVLLFIIVFL
ncbi:hypothetical protein JCM5296_007146 [Sporobolomyces johnsonii]